MEAEDKLAEAQYFLSKMKTISRTLSPETEFPKNRNLLVLKDEFMYNLSAFIIAWRSVFDILLYDYAERYFKLGPARDLFLDIKRFKMIANVLDNHGLPEAKEFIKWYKKKEGILSKEPLWFLRIYIAHRGGKKLNVHVKDHYSLESKPLYIPPSTISGGTLPASAVYIGMHLVKVKAGEELYIAEYPETVMLTMCEKVFNLMEQIVKESRVFFK